MNPGRAPPPAPRRKGSPWTAAALSVTVVVALCTSVVATVPALAGTGSGSVQGTTTPTWLQRLNAVRVAAGVAEVSENSAWTLGIQHHLTYLAKTDPSLRTGQYASAHTENPASPYYTTDGALEGSRSNLVRNASQTDVSAVDYWFGAPFHAIGMLRAGLSRTAFAQDATYAGLDIITGFPRPSRTGYAPACTTSPACGCTSATTWSLAPASVPDRRAWRISPPGPTYGGACAAR